jgi:hypothetical protein
MKQTIHPAAVMDSPMSPEGKNRVSDDQKHGSIKSITCVARFINCINDTHTQLYAKENIIFSLECHCKYSAKT